MCEAWPWNLGASRCNALSGGSLRTEESPCPPGEILEGPRFEDKVRADEPIRRSAATELDLYSYIGATIVGDSEDDRSFVVRPSLYASPASPIDGESAEEGGKALRYGEGVNDCCCLKTRRGQGYVDIVFGELLKPEFGTDLSRVDDQSFIHKHLRATRYRR